MYRQGIYKKVMENKLKNKSRESISKCFEATEE